MRYRHVLPSPLTSREKRTTKQKTLSASKISQRTGEHDGKSFRQDCLSTACMLVRWYRVS